MDEKKETIKALASKFRNAIEACDPGDLPVGLEKFPLGSCGDSVLILGTYLKENGLGDFYYVSGENYDDSGLYTHAWLWQEGIIVDITADQFDGIEEKVIVTRQSKWHDSFQKRIEHIADFRIYDGHILAMLEKAYIKISSQIKE